MTIGETPERAQNAGQARADAETFAPPGAKAAAQPLSTSPIKRVFSAFLAVTLAVSMTPSAALAQVQDATASDAQASAQSQDNVALQDEAAKSVASSEAVAHDASQKTAPEAANGENPDQPTDATAALQPASADQPSASADVNPVAPETQNSSIATQTDVSLSSSAKVYIQDAKDKNSSYSTKSGALKAGDTLWANMYDAEDPDDYWSDDVSVANPGTWAYTWYAGVSASSSASSYTEVVGREQSLTVSDAMAGKYFICKVTADGKDYYGPHTSYGDVNSNYIPGPVLAAGQAELYKVMLSNNTPSVGDTLTATAYTGYSTVAGSDVTVTYTWSYADSAYGTFTAIEGQSSNTLKLTDAYKGKYIKVTATAGVNEKTATTSDVVMTEGAIKLAGVELKASSTEIGATLTAKAYTGSSYSPTYVDNSKVTYTWKKYKGSSAPSYSTTWEPIEGASGPTFTVTDDLEGCYITVSANAGANDVTFGGSYSPSYVGPFKQAGAVDINSVVLAPAGSTSGSYVYTVGDTVQALAREKGAATGVYIDASKLNFQWQVYDSKDGSYADIPGETNATLSLTDALEGKLVKCIVSAKIGSSTYPSRATKAIAKAGSVNITKVEFEGAAGKINVGDTLTATATAASGDVTNNPHVTWSWYYGDSSTSCDTKIEGATGNTFTVTSDYLGKYIEARANGGFGDTKATRGPVVEPGAVSLHHVELSGSAKVDATLTAKAYVSSYTPVSASDKVHYQWQYTDTKTTTDGAFKDIEGAADAPTFTITDALVGKYIRVKATSDGSVVSTYQKGSYSSSYVNPLGPVTLAGQYTLSNLEIKDVASTILQVGRTITPQAKVSSGYSDKDAPADAKLTYTWYAKGEGDASWQQVSEGVAANGALTIGDALAGKSLKVTASALDNTVEWVSGTTVAAAGQYNLLRVITTPQAMSSSTNVVAGDTVTAEAQSVRADSNTINGVKVIDNVAFTWYIADAPDGAFTQLEGVSGARITVPDAAAGKYLKVVATSGSSSVETVFANKIIDRTSLAAVLQKLNSNNVKPTPAYNKDTNINAVLEAKIAELGFEGVTAKVKSVGFSATDAKATVGISAADDATNGNVTYFYMDPNDYSGFNFDGLRRATVAFTLSKDGETADYAPGSINIPWNEDMLQQRLSNVAKQLSIQYAAGDTAEAVTGNVTLPYKAGSNNKYDVTWKSSSDQIKVSGYGWDNYTGKVTRTGSDRTVGLTATVKLMSNYGGSDVTIVGTHTFNLTVKGDLDKVAADKAALQNKVDAAFTYNSVKYSGTSTIADKDGLTADLQMPTTRTIGVDGKYYKVEYFANTSDITFNGYKGTVYQPQPGQQSAKTAITLTVTDKSNPEIAVSKTLDYQVKPLEQAELDAELSLMEQAKAGYAAAILNGQDAKAVTANMHAFQKAYLDANGNLAWTYDRDTTDSTASGIIPVELPGYDDMGTQGWRLFKSSNEAVVAHENLKVTQPEYSTKVTITSNLSSEKYARYAERFPENATYAKLANQEATATITVTGTSGITDPNAGTTVTVTARVVGITAKDAQGNYSSLDVVPLTQTSFAYDDQVTAAEALKNLLTAAGCTDIESNQLGLTSVKLPDGRVLDSDFSEPYRYWSFIVNGEYADEGASTYHLKDGDCVEYRYVDNSGTQVPSNDPQVNPDAEHPGIAADWGGFNNGNTGLPTNALTPTTPTQNPSWASSLLSSEDRKAGKSAYASDPLVLGGKLYVVTGTSFYDPNDGWKLTKGMARLLRINPADGSVESELQLGTSMDSTCRPVYADGIIVIPLAGGYIQAVSATTFETLWFTQAFANQSISTLTVDGDYVYLATLDRFGEQEHASDVVSGTVRRINLHTGAIAGSAQSNEGGYYWAGGVMVNGYYVIGSDSGEVRVYSADLSECVGKLSIGNHIRSSLVVSGGYVYAVTRDDGTLHQLQVQENGSISQTASVQFAPYSTSTPVISGNFAFIGGATGSSWGSKGLLSVVNLSDMSVQQITQADGADLIAESKSTPLVSQRDGKTYVYFTCNGAVFGAGGTYLSGGGVYMYELGESQATEVFIPGAQYAQYCMASVITDSEGNLYYTNDSGNLFCIKTQSHRVTFDSQGGSRVDDAVCASGSALAKPADPSREGYKFEGWFTDAACTKAYDFSAPVVSGLKLYAKWTKANNSGTGGGVEPNNGDSSDNNGGQLPSGTVAPGASPVAAGVATQQAAGASLAAEQTGAVAATNAANESSAATASSNNAQQRSATASNSAAQDGGSTDAPGTPIWPYIVLGIGVLGVAAATIWWIVAKRRRKDAQE